MYLTTDDEHIRPLEALLLRVVNLEGNKVKGRLRGAQDLVRLLKRKMDESQRDETATLLGGRFVTHRRRSKTRAATGTLVLGGLFERPVRLVATWKGNEYKASLRRDGHISYKGKLYDSPTSAGRVILGRAVNGWQFWRYRNPRGEWGQSGRSEAVGVASHDGIRGRRSPRRIRCHSRDSVRYGASSGCESGCAAMQTQRVTRAPRCIVIAGPNGAGKTTFAREFLAKETDVVQFVNADLIASGLSALRPEIAAVAAGRVFLAELDRLAHAGAGFAFETTLSGRAYVGRLRNGRRLAIVSRSCT